jgi:hypothetical protein
VVVSVTVLPAKLEAIRPNPSPSSEKLGRAFAMGSPPFLTNKRPKATLWPMPECAFGVPWNPVRLPPLLRGNRDMMDSLRDHYIMKQGGCQGVLSILLLAGDAERNSLRLYHSITRFARMPPSLLQGGLLVRWTSGFRTDGSQACEAWPCACSTVAVSKHLTTKGAQHAAPLPGISRDCSEFGG